jgi:2-C-methyl-D-erythritol 2,4-cyclodiphosphate synthase
LHLRNKYDKLRYDTLIFEDMKERITMRVGMGYDVHKLVEGRRLILGGVEIPYEKGLLGHSDADVLVHAVMDALLGAAALGDIGKHFPDTDPAYEGADSMKLLEEVRKLLDEHNFMIGNVDATVIAQRPKLAPYIEMMRENIAARLLIDKNQVNVKATTEEGLGFTGQGQGISSQAICLLETIDNFDYRSSRVVDDTVENAANPCMGCMGCAKR